MAGKSPRESTLGSLTCAGVLMALLLGAALLFIHIPFGLLYLAIVVPAMLSILVLLKREPVEKASVGRMLLDIVMTFSITLGTIALLIGGAFVALVIMCLLEGSSRGTIMVR